MSLKYKRMVEDVTSIEFYKNYYIDDFHWTSVALKFKVPMIHKHRELAAIFIRPKHAWLLRNTGVRLYNFITIKE